MDRETNDDIYRGEEMRTSVKSTYPELPQGTFNSVITWSKKGSGFTKYFFFFRRYMRTPLHTHTNTHTSTHTYTQN